VAGGSGFLGSAIVRALLDRERPVTILSRHPRAAARRFPSAGVSFRGGDVTRPDTLVPALGGMDVVVQCVQFPGYPIEDPGRRRTFLEVDAAGTRALAEAARAAGVRKLVYLSGVGADIGSRRSWYRAKGIAEEAVAASGLTHVVVRPSWVYGPGDASLNRFVSILRHVPWFFPQIGSGGQRVNAVFVEDVASLVADVALTPVADGATIEIGGPQVLTLDELLRVTMRVLGRTKPIIHFPIPLVKLGAALLELLPGQILSRDAVDFITQSGVADLAALRRYFPDRPLRPLEPALRTYLPRR